MTISLKHDFQSAKSDGLDSTRIQPSHWNAEHVLEMATARILGRVSASTGDVEELTADDIYDLLGITGKTMLFEDTSAPTGWTKKTNHNDKALRIVSGTVSSGGSSAFSSIFGSGKATGSTTLSQANLPAVNLSHSLAAADHTHSVSGNTGTESADHSHNFSDGSFVTSINSSTSGRNTTSPSSNTVTSVSTNSAVVSGTTGGRSAAHTHFFSATSSGASALGVSGTVSLGGSGSGHTHSLSLDLQYVDVIAATKDA